MLQYKDKKLLCDKSIMNTKTYAKYHPNDVEVIEYESEVYIKPKYMDKINKLNVLSNWIEFNEKEPTLKITERNIVTLDKLIITHNTDAFNVLLITYLKEMSGGSIITTNQKHLKGILSKLEKRNDAPLPWKYVSDLLQYVQSNIDLFMIWIGEGNGTKIKNRKI